MIPLWLLRQRDWGIEGLRKCESISHKSMLASNIQDFHVSFGYYSDSLSRFKVPESSSWRFYRSVPPTRAVFCRRKGFSSRKNQATNAIIRQVYSWEACWSFYCLVSAGPLTISIEFMNPIQLEGQINYYRLIIATMPHKIMCASC